MAVEKYPLEALLSVRQYREDAAKRQLSRAQEDVRAAEAAVKEKEQALEDWRLWRVQETDRRYEALLGKTTNIEKINIFNQGLAALANDELAKVAQVDAARKHVSECFAKLDKAKTAAQVSRKNTAKIETHRSIWSEESKKAAERAEDLELEEFKPMNHFGQGAEDDVI